MKTIFLTAMLVLLSIFANATLTVTDVSFDELYINEEPWIIPYCDSFTISTSSSVNPEFFYIGTDVGGIYLYDINQQLIDGYSFLDGRILEGVNPQITILNDIVSNVQYFGNVGNEDRWLVMMNISSVMTLEDPTSPLIQFNYVPEPATVSLLAVGSLALLRKQK